MINEHHLLERLDSVLADSVGNRYRIELHLYWIAFDQCGIAINNDAIIAIPTGNQIVL